MNDHIIHEYYYLSFSDHSGERFIHVSLEGGRRVSLSKEHHKGFEYSSWRDKRHFPLVSSFDSDISKSPSHIELGEVR